MRISLTDAGKRFNREWIFRHLSYEFSSGNSYAIIGPNGSGKSTLLQTLSASMDLSEGSIQYSIDNLQFSVDNVYNQVSICAPYLEVVEEMTAKEFLDFHHGFKPFLPGFSTERIIEIVGLNNAIKKQIRYYSSGMKQRIKLAQAVFSDVPVVLLDEPCTNLDEAGIELYNKLIDVYCRERLVIVSSNDPQEYQFCQQRINILEWKM